MDHNSWSSLLTLSEDLRHLQPLLYWHRKLHEAPTLVVVMTTSHVVVMKLGGNSLSFVPLWLGTPPIGIRSKIAKYIYIYINYPYKVYPSNVTSNPNTRRYTRLVKQTSFSVVIVVI